MWKHKGKGLTYENFLVKYKLITIFVILLFMFISFFLFYMQIVKGNKYAKISENQRIYNEYEYAPRGIIFSRDNVKLAENVYSYALLFYPSKYFNQQNINEYINNINNILNKKIDIHKISCKNNNYPIQIINKLTKKEICKIHKSKKFLNNTLLIKETNRIYNYPKIMSHIIGYISKTNKKDTFLNKNNIMDYIGRGGIEQFYNNYLMGINGSLQIEMDAVRRHMRVLRYRKPKPGNNIYSTIDYKLQNTAYNELKKSSSGKGAIIVLDTKNGAVRVLISYPGFNANKINTKQFIKYFKNKKLPFFNRAIHAHYPPGSIFKIVLMAAALNVLQTDPNEIIYCPGVLKIGNRKYSCCNKISHGNINMISAILKSCNIYFYKLGIKLGINNIEKYAKNFFLDQKTGIDLPNEKNGFIPTPKWKKKNTGTSWFIGDTAIFSIGQGALEVTPIQMACMALTIANKGIYYKPYVVNKITTYNGIEIYKHTNKYYKCVKLSKQNWETINYALIQTIEEGTGIKSKFRNIKIAGKTGTAQNASGKPHAWFISYAPADNPEIALVVLIENGGLGGINAVPIGKKIYEKYFEKR
ncbi:MAG: penicillin-binding protein 2 [Endomicrobium sp.]|jgi:penicillin-binding protein 2|nr:penicillin-binding protein 2 [Endomicrobium sp.]